MHMELTLDCVDLDAVAAFWRAALGYAAVGTFGRRYVALAGDGICHRRRCERLSPIQ